MEENGLAWQEGANCELASRSDAGAHCWGEYMESGVMSVSRPQVYFSGKIEEVQVGSRMLY